jgi:MGT family glycosyltransferase
MNHIAYVLPPAHGHVNPVLAVIRELVRRGEQVTCYNTPEFREVLEHAGAAFRPYAATAMTSAELSRLLAKGGLPKIAALVLRSTELVLPRLLEDLASEPPDLLVVDSVALWGEMAGRILRVPTAGSISHFVLDDRLLGFRDFVTMIWQAIPVLPSIVAARRRLTRRYGAGYPVRRGLFPMRGVVNVVFTARDLQPDSRRLDDTFLFVGPSIDPKLRRGAAADVPPPPGRRIYVSLGTIHHTHTAFFKTCLEAFAGYPAQVVLAVGSDEAVAALGPVPENCVVRSSVAQLEVLQRTDVFVTHGGMNSVHEALYYGVPLVLIPHQAEQLFNARCIERQGAGVLIDAQVRGRRVTARRLRATVDAVLSTARFGERARDVQRSLRATGGYGAAADAI